MPSRFTLLTDEHVPRPLVKALRDRGWTVLRVIELPELGESADDGLVFAYALEHGYVVLSSDERALWRPGKYLEEGQPFRGMVCWTQYQRDRMTIGEAVEVLEGFAQEDEPFAWGYRFIQPRS